MTEPATYRSVFAVAEFRWLWLAHLLSVAGDQLARVALTVLVFDRTQSAGLTALTYAVSYVPDLVGGTVLAGVADRYSRRTVMVVTDVGRAVVVAVMAVPGVPLGVQVGLLVVVQLLAAPFSAARQAVLPDILTGDRLTVGFGIISMTYQFGLVLGFGAGAAVVAALGTSGALWVNAVSFIVSGVMLAFGLGRHLPMVSRVAGGEARSSMITGGWRVVAGDRRLLALLLIACCSGFYVVPEGLAVPYADELDVGTAAVGWLLAANPVGTVVGMVVLRRIPPDRRLALLGPLAVASSLVLVPMWWGPGLVVSVFLWGVSGACSAHDMMTQAAYVAAAPAQRRGQVVGVAIASLRAAQGAGIVVAGGLAQFISPAAVIAGAATVGVVVSMWAAVMWSRAAVSSREGSGARDGTGDSAQ